MDFAPGDEDRALRAAVADVAKDFGPAYYAAKAEAREPTSELWAELGKTGYLGVNIPEAALSAVDAAIQAHGGNGVSTSTGKVQKNVLRGRYEKLYDVPSAEPE